MLDQIGLKVRKHQSCCQFCLHLKDDCETSRCLIVDRWSNDGSDGVIVLIKKVINDYVVQDNINTHNQPKSAPRVRPIDDDYYVEPLFQ
jgi:hypothetical protein